MNDRGFFSQAKRFISTAAFILTFALAPAAAFASSYLPGQTLNPSCLPTDPTCLVSSLPIQTGSILFGNGTATAATSSNLFWDNTDGWLGIGTSSPSQPLSVHGNGYLTGALTASAINASGGGYFAGNVGIGTTSGAFVGTSTYATALAINGNLDLNGQRSTLFFRGDDATDQIGGLQLDALNYGALDIITPTNNAGNTQNSTIQLGGNGNFNSNLVNLTVTGTTTALTGFAAGSNSISSTGGFFSTGNLNMNNYSGPTSGNNIFGWNGNASGNCNSECGMLDFLANSDNIQGGSHLVDVARFDQNFGGASSTGGFTGTDVIINQTAPTGNTNDTGYYVAQQSVAQATANDNGTSTAYSGHLYGLSTNVRLTGGATYWDQLVGQENDIAAAAGSNVNDKIGLQIVELGNDAVSANHTDAGISLNNSSSATGWKLGLAFGAYSGSNPVNAAGTLIGTYAHGVASPGIGAMGTVANGIDFSQYTFTNDFLKSNGFTVDGNGNASTTQLSAFNGAYFGSTATSSFGANGALTTVGTLSAGQDATHNGIQIVPGSTSGSNPAYIAPLLASGQTNIALQLRSSGSGQVQLENTTGASLFNALQDGTATTSTDYMTIHATATGNNAIYTTTAGGDSRVDWRFLTQGTGSVFDFGAGGDSPNNGNTDFEIDGGSTPTSWLTVKGSTTSAPTLGCHGTNCNIVLSPTGTGDVGIGTSTPGSLLSLNNLVNFTTATSTFYSTGGINLTSGCFAVNGSCLSLTGASSTLLTDSNTFSGNDGFSSGVYFGLTATSSFGANGALTTVGTLSAGQDATHNGIQIVPGLASGSNPAYIAPLLASGQNNIALQLRSSGTGLVQLENGLGSSLLTAVQDGAATTSTDYMTVHATPTGNNAIYTTTAGGDSRVDWRFLTQGTGSVFDFGAGGDSPNNGNTDFEIDGGSTPTSWLTVKGSTTSAPTLGCHGTNCNIVLSPTGTGDVGIGTSTPWGRLSITGVDASALTPGLVVSDSNNNFLFGVFDNGFVGVGTSTPYARVSIAGSAGGTSPLLSISTSTSAASSSTALLVDSNGNVWLPNSYQQFGIGTTNVTGLGNTALTVANPGASAAETIDAGGSVSGSANGDAYIQLNGYAAGAGVGLRLWANSGGLGKIGTTNNWPLAFMINNAEVARINTSGSFGIGTTSPYSKLEVWGPDSASTTAFSVVNNASTTVFAAYDNGNATYSGSIFQSSDERLKTDITDLDASTSLALVDQLNPVSYTRIDEPNFGTNLGFLAQQVQQIFPELVSTSSPTALTPDGTLTLNYQGLISPLVKAVQALSTEITSLQNTVAGFADSFTTNELTYNRASGNQITTNELCVNKSDGTPVCISGDQLAAVLASENQAASNGLPASGDANATSSTVSTPPVIQVNGDNPAIIQIGASYTDLGATITGPTADLNLDINTFVNGSPMSQVQLDTSTAATDTIDYVVTDQNGLTSTSTRTVIIEAATSSLSGGQ